MSEFLHDPVFLSLATGVLIVLGTVGIRTWSKVRQAALQNDLKLELLRQGMSADEICQVVESRPGAPARRRCKEYA